jgi:signal peptidase II
MKALSRLLSTLVLSLILDGSTKVLAEQSLTLYEPVPVLGQLFRLTLGYNTGVAFGLFANGGAWPLVITGGIIAGLAVWFGRNLLLGQLPPATGWGIGLLLGGAIGNFADRLLDGQVTDFLDFGWGLNRWPTFNLADSFILIGIGLLLLIDARAASQAAKWRAEESSFDPSA